MSQQEKLWNKPYLILIGCNLLLFFTLQMIITSNPGYIREQYNASDMMVSLFTSLFALSAIAARLYAGRAIGKGHRSVILFAGLIIAWLATTGYYITGGMLLLLFMRMIFGIGFGLSSTVFPTMASDVIPAKRMGEGMGYFGLSTSISMSLGPLVGLFLLEHYNFQVLTTVAVVMIAVIFPLAYLVRKSASNHHGPEKSVREVEQPQGSVKRALFLPALLNFLLAVTYGGIISFMALFGEEVHLSGVGAFFLINAIAIIIVRPFSGKMFDKIGPKAVLLPGAALTIAGLVLLSLATEMSVLAAAAICYGAGYGFIQPSLQAWMIQKVSPEKRGVANGLFLNSLDFGIAVGAMVLGIIASGTSYVMMYRLSSIIMVVFLILFIVSFINTRAKKSTSKSNAM
ncbi:MFS transporter [Marinicrinis lubricantis]|uniref:MFS transporter n=1 Tax=Marinicrinis lubricantis TaxID=2086470 RepID=A0ABW1IJK6_9BACL